MNNSAVSAEAIRFRKKVFHLAPIVLWAFLIPWYFTVGVMLFILVPMRATIPLVMTCFFAAVGLVFVRLAVVTTLSAVRFRGAEIELQSPGRAGGTIAGVVRVPQRVLKHDSLEFRMGAWERMSDSSDRLLWETTEPVSRPGPGGGELATLPFSIHLPFNAMPASAAGRGYSFYWQLELRSKKGSVAFEVPVDRPAPASS